MQLLSSLSVVMPCSMNRLDNRALADAVAAADDFAVRHRGDFEPGDRPPAAETADDAAAALRSVSSRSHCV